MEHLNFTGIYTGLFSLFAIIIGFVWVIKLEYHIGACIQRIIVFVGILLMLSSYFSNSFFLSAFIGILSGTIIWGGTEMKDQEERSLEGQFPVKKKKLCYKFELRRKLKLRKK